MKVVVIVEGYGEVAAVPVLLRRLAQWRTPGVVVEVPTPIRVPRNRFLNRQDEFQRFLRLAAEKCGKHGWILILLDADDDCPAQFAPQVLARAQACVSDHQVSVVLAMHEYEAWFIAAARSLHGRRGFTFELPDPVDAEAPRDAKGWLQARMGAKRYGETTDQPAFSASFDLDQAFSGSRSFRKLCMEWDQQVTLTLLRE